MLSSARVSIIMLCLLAIGSLTSGCATMANTDQQISVYTIPDGADVAIGEIKGVSPMSATVPGGYAIPQSIQVSKEGYQSQTVTVQRGFRISSLVTDILPGIFLVGIPLIVDLGFPLRGKHLVHDSARPRRDRCEHANASRLPSRGSDWAGQIRCPLAMTRAGLDLHLARRAFPSALPFPNNLTREP